MGQGVIFTFAIPSLNGHYTAVTVANILPNLPNPITYQNAVLVHLGPNVNTARNYITMIAAGDVDEGGMLIVDFYGGGSKEGEIKIEGFAGVNAEFHTHKVPVAWQ